MHYNNNFPTNQMSNSFDAMECIKNVRYKKLEEDMLFKDIELEILNNISRGRY